MERTAEPLLALAPALARAGVAVVLGMQGNVTMKTAAKFLSKFFAQLNVDGIPAKAMAEARQTVRDRRRLVHAGAVLPIEARQRLVQATIRRAGNASYSQTCTRVSARRSAFPSSAPASPARTACSPPGRTSQRNGLPGARYPCRG